MDARVGPGTWALRVLRFAGRVLRDFLGNHGVLLAGGVGYNTLLSIVPFLALATSALSLVFERQRILEVLRRELQVLVPQNTDAIVGAVDGYLEQHGLTSAVSVVLLLFFSAMAFSMLEQAMGAIFHRATGGRRRHFLVTAVLPYGFVFVLVAGLFAVTLASAGLELAGAVNVRWHGEPLTVARETNLLLRLAGSAGLVLLFAGVYRVMPVMRVAPSRALIGGLCAAGLWQLVGRGLVSYFATLSQVNVIYGSLATVVVLLLLLEIAVIILLLGAQVIAELEASAAAGVPWWERAP